MSIAPMLWGTKQSYAKMLHQSFAPDLLHLQLHLQLYITIMFVELRDPLCSFDVLHKRSGCRIEIWQPSPPRAKGPLSLFMLK